MYIVIHVSGISHCSACLRPWGCNAKYQTREQCTHQRTCCRETSASRVFFPLSMKNLPTACYFDSCFFYMHFFVAFRIIAQGVGVLFDRISSKSTVQLQRTGFVDSNHRMG